jgi:sulfane dehydrogenase subunit SoxC
MTRRNPEAALPEFAAANGLIHRRELLLGGLMASVAPSLGAQQLPSPPSWTLTPGRPMSGYGMPSEWRKNVQRGFTLPPGRPGTGASRTPLHLLEGTITPNGLHFERHHNGVPDIDPARHQLLVHGLVDRPLTFTLDDLLRYPLQSHIRFIECAGNSGGGAAPSPTQADAGTLHGLVSCAQWTGVPLSVLLQEAGIKPAASWVIAEGADAAALSRSIPLSKCLDDAMIALYQNGEAVRPEQGFPMRLLLPGFQGNTNIKWLRRLRLTDKPANTKDETSKYSELMPDGRARQFMLEMGPKSVILKPSFGMTMQGRGFYEISGIAWSGAGRVRRVEISADGGRTWAEALLEGPVLPKALTRFRLAWRWDGSPLQLLSRATDDAGGTQPPRSEWIKQYAPGQGYHYNAIQAWDVDAAGKVTNAYT